MNPKIDYEYVKDEYGSVLVVYISSESKEKSQKIRDDLNKIVKYDLDAHPECDYAFDNTFSFEVYLSRSIKPNYVKKAINEALDVLNKENIS